VRLSFTPTVIGNRVHLKVKPEVSTLDFANGVNIQGFRIPALSTRRTETELELIDGQTFAIAGLMNNQMNTSLSKIPGIGDIPILGLLFKSKSAQKNQTELVVMITPQILPRNSPGVTPNLPRIQEPYMPPMPAKKTMEMPPPAFATPVASTAPQAPAVATAPPSTRPVPASPAAAATTLKALTPSRPVAHVPAGDVLPAKQTVGVTAPVAATQAVAPQTTQKAISKAAAEQAHKAEEQAKAAEAKERMKQVEADRRAAKIEQERQAREAHEQAKRDAEQAKRDAEAARIAAIEAKKQAEIDKIQQKAVDEAAAKAKAAEAKYQAELSKLKTQQRH
jgi:hypothetical protein